MKQLHLREPWGNRDDPKSYGAKIHSGNGTDGPPKGTLWVTLGRPESLTHRARFCKRFRQRSEALRTLKL